VVETTGSFSGVRTSDFPILDSTPNFLVRTKLYDGQWEAIVVSAPISTLDTATSNSIRNLVHAKSEETIYGDKLDVFHFLSDAQESFQVKREPLYLLGKGRLRSLVAPDAPPKSLPLNQYIR
jgi:hypothetical protein